MTPNSSTDSATRDGHGLHGAIMNIEAPEKVKRELEGAPKGFYLLGHRDARHAAAELALGADTLLAASRAEVERLRAELSAMTEHRDRLDALVNSPETRDFLAGVRNEVAHQVERWGTVHDRAKEPADWFWLVGYLGGKALSAHVKGDTEKAMHHCISTSAALANWHAHIAHGSGLMQPGSSDLQQFLRDTFGANFIEYQADRAALSTKKD